MTKPIIGIGSDIAQKQGERDQAFVYTTYVDALRRAGAIPLLIPPQPENSAVVVEELDGLVLAGGEDCDPAAYGAERHRSVEPMDPRRQVNDLSLAQLARQRGVPTLGICLGMQMMNVAAGGTLIQDIGSEVKSEIDHASDPSDRHHHGVSIEEGTRLAGILGARALDVNSSHHQAVKDVGQGLRVTAHAPDGVIEGVEDPGHPFYIGVQWHPEDMNGERSAALLFSAFVEAARRRAEAKRRGATDLSPAAAAKSE